MQVFEQGLLAPLPYTMFPAERVVDAFRTMQQSRHLGKIVGGPPHPPVGTGQAQSQSGKTLRLDPEASYLVTGGTRGFGLETARRLALRGARNLILLSRSGVSSPEAVSAVAELEAQGVRVLAAAVDVADAAALGSLLDEAARIMPRLRGVVHAAMVLDDGLACDLDEERMRRVLAPKVRGAWNLHRLTSGLDFFVLFSSATTVVGNPGQANYVAANCALEALARRRRAAGLPALALAWGAIADAGYLTRHPESREALSSRLGSPLTAKAALDVMEREVFGTRAVAAVFDPDWGSLSRFLPAMGAPRLAHMASRGGRRGADGEAEAENLRQRLLSLPPAEALAELKVLLGQLVSTITRTPAEHIDPQKNLADWHGPRSWPSNWAYPLRSALAWPFPTCPWPRGEALLPGPAHPPGMTGSRDDVRHGGEDAFNSLASRPS
jgi:NAD(P)-dependent dehydrogenase (short-subunit alcohol dehydrogenase family)